MSEPPIRLLIIDSDSASASLLQQSLEQQGFQVSSCTNPHEVAESLVGPHSYNLLLVSDIISSDSVNCLLDQAHAASPPMPVLLLCHAAKEADRIKALEAGADDLLVRPFGLAECAARCRALVRRQHFQRHPLSQRWRAGYGDA
jgi:DNA-binding response OmpR family regulator